MTVIHHLKGRNIWFNPRRKKPARVPNRGDTHDELESAPNPSTSQDNEPPEEPQAE
jgi:hypothetical protein